MKKMLLLLLVLIFVSCEETIEQPQIQTSDDTTTLNQNKPVETETETETEATDIEEKTTIVKVGVDNLNLRDNFNTNANLIGQLHYGDLLTVDGEFYDESGRLWYGISTENQVGYIASWFTLDEEANRTSRIHSLENDLIGFFHLDDLTVTKNNHKLHIIRKKLYEELAATLHDEVVHFISPLENDSAILNLPFDVTLTYNDLLQDYQESLVKDLHIDFISNQLVTKSIMRDGSITYHLFTQDQIISSSREPLASSLGHELYCLSDDLQSFTIYNIENNLVLTFDVYSPITYIKIEDQEITLKTKADTRQLLKDSTWTMVDLDGASSTLLYRLVEDTFIIEKRMDIDLEDFSQTSNLVINDQGVFTVYKNQEDLYTLVETEDNQRINFSDTSWKLYFNNGVHYFEGYRSLTYKHLEKNEQALLFTFSNQSTYSDENYDERNYFILDSLKGNIQSYHNNLSFSKDKDYFIAANYYENNATDIAVYSVSDLEKIHTIPDYYGYGVDEILANAWDDQVVRFSLYRQVANTWLDIQNYQLTYEEYFDPSSGQEDLSPEASSDLISLDFYDKPSGTLISEASVEIGSLIFADRISIEDGSMVFWYYHDSYGYAKRPMTESQFDYQLLKPLYFVNSIGKELKKMPSRTCINFRNEIIHDYIYYEIDHVLDIAYLLNVDELFEIKVGFNYAFSQDQNYLASIQNTELALDETFEIWNLKTLDREFHHDSWQIDTPGHYLVKDLMWQEDNSLYIDYSETSNISTWQEKKCFKTEGEWIIEDRY